MSITREEAIEELERLLRHWDLIDEGIYDLSEHDQDAVEIALSALRAASREQVEKVWRGGWIAVRESEITGFNPEFAGCDPIGGYKCSRCKEEAVLDCNDEFVLDNFCPRCGAPMTDEAVQMVMRRLEEMHETT